MDLRSVFIKLNISKNILKIRVILDYYANKWACFGIFNKLKIYYGNTRCQQYFTTIAKPLQAGGDERGYVRGSSGF
jgi:hypothetical protein